MRSLISGLPILFHCSMCVFLPIPYQPNLLMHFYGRLSYSATGMLVSASISLHRHSSFLRFGAGLLPDDLSFLLGLRKVMNVQIICFFSDCYNGSNVLFSFHHPRQKSLFQVDLRKVHFSFHPPLCFIHSFILSFIRSINTD